LTGEKAGEKKKDGHYPKNSLNFRIEERLKKMNKISKEAVAKKNNKRK
jgi:hypothetical protein